MPANAPGPVHNIAAPPANPEEENNPPAQGLVIPQAQKSGPGPVSIPTQIQAAPAMGILGTPLGMQHSVLPNPQAQTNPPPPGRAIPQALNNPPSTANHQAQNHPLPASPAIPQAQNNPPCAANPQAHNNPRPAGPAIPQAQNNPPSGVNPAAQNNALPAGRANLQPLNNPKPPGPANLPPRNVLLLGQHYHYRPGNIFAINHCALTMFIYGTPVRVQHAPANVQGLKNPAGAVYLQALNDPTCAGNLQSLNNPAGAANSQAPNNPAIQVIIPARIPVVPSMRILGTQLGMQDSAPVDIRAAVARMVEDPGFEYLGMA